MESAFRRPDGLLALVATPTVAQGINLPAEAVIIAGDSRIVEDGDNVNHETLAVHELLNAAGRAGRAGHFAHGIVLDVPAPVFSFSRDEKKFSFEGMSHVLELFESPDQCVDVVDPLTQVIDRISQAGIDTDVREYLVRRVAGLDEPALRKMLRAALGNALSTERETRANAQATLLREKAVEIDRELSDQNVEIWNDLAGRVGVSPYVIEAIAKLVPAANTINEWSFDVLLQFHKSVLIENSGTLFSLVDPGSSSLAKILGRQKKDVERNGRRIKIPSETIEEWEQRWRLALSDILPLWMAGIPLKEIGKSLYQHRGPGVVPVNLARRFAVQASSGLGHGISIVARIVDILLDGSETPQLNSWLQLVGGCVREGFDDPDKLLLFWHLRRFPGRYSRVATHRIFAEKVGGNLPSWQELSDVDDRRTALYRLLRESDF